MQKVENKYIQRIAVNNRVYTDDTVKWVDELLKTMCLKDVHRITDVPQSTICHWSKTGKVRKPTITKGNTGVKLISPLRPVERAVRCLFGSGVAVSNSYGTSTIVITNKSFTRAEFALLKAAITLSDCDVSRIKQGTFTITLGRSDE